MAIKGRVVSGNTDYDVGQDADLTLTEAGLLRVNGSGGTFSIDQTTPGTTNAVTLVDSNGDPLVSSDTLPVVANASEAHVGQVGGTTPRVTATFTRLDEATIGAYAAGDNIDNSTTAGSVVKKTFSVGRAGAAIVSGRISGVRCVVAPASGNLVIANMDFDLLIFRPGTNIPFTDGSYPADNAALAVSAAAMRDLVAVFSFVNSGWRSPAGSLTVAGVAGYQSVTIASGRSFAPFNLSDLGAATTLPYLLQAQAAWNPGHVNQQFDFALDVDLD